MLEIFTIQAILIRMIGFINFLVSVSIHSLLTYLNRAASKATGNIQAYTTRMQVFMTSMITFHSKLICFVLYLCNEKKATIFFFIQKDRITVNAKVTEPSCRNGNNKKLKKISDVLKLRQTRIMEK